MNGLLRLLRDSVLIKCCLSALGGGVFVAYAAGSAPAGAVYFLACFLVGCALGRWFSARRQVASAVAEATATAQATASNRSITVIGGIGAESGNYDYDDASQLHYDEYNTRREQLASHQLRSDPNVLASGNRGSSLGDLGEAREARFRAYQERMNPVAVNSSADWTELSNSFDSFEFEPSEIWED